MSNEKRQLKIKKEKNPQYSQQAFFTPIIRYTISPAKKQKRYVASFSYNLYNDKDKSAERKPTIPTPAVTKDISSELILCMPEEYRTNSTIYR